jgi:prophage regulatory protein
MMNYKQEKRGYSIPTTGFMRLPQVLAFVPVSKSTWWNGVRDGRFPQPVKLGPRMTAWKAEDIQSLIERLSTSQTL